MAINTDSHNGTICRKKENFVLFRPKKDVSITLPMPIRLTVNLTACIKTTPVKVIQNSTKEKLHKFQSYLRNYLKLNDASWDM